MTRNHLRWLGFLSTLPLVGCTSHTIRDGIWALEVRLHRVENGEPLPVPGREVRLAIQWVTDDKRPDLIENVELGPLSANAAADGAAGPAKIARKSMFAEIHRHDEAPAIMKVDTHRDEDWVWQMHGVVKSSELVEGHSISARPRNSNDASFIGEWTLRWLRKE